VLSYAELLGIFIFHLILTAAPGVAAVLCARRYGVRDVPVLLAIGLAGSGLASLLAFWAFYATPWVGKAYAYGVFAGSVGLIAWSWRVVREDTDLLRRLATPLGLWVLGSAFIIFFGFLHGGMDSPLAMAATRFSGQLPSDNDIPHYFAEWFAANGHHGVPPLFEPGWHFSDRPPLQVGYVLAQRPFGWDTRTLNYQVLCVLAQQLWIVGLWALLLAANLRARTRSLAMVAVLFSDVAIVNGFFVWPKLLAAAFLLAAIALVVAPRGSTLKASPPTIVLAGLLCGLAYMAHGSSVFGLIPLGLIAIYRGLPNWRWVAAGLAAGAVLVVSWSAYQRYEDPPGNRLPKWMLAGVTEVDPRGVKQAITDAYGEAGVDGTLEHKGENFLTMLGGGPGTVETNEWIPFGGAVVNFEEAFDDATSGKFGRAAIEVRQTRFFYLVPSLGLLLLGLPLIALGRIRRRIEGDDWAFAKFCLWFFALCSVIWGLILFGTAPSRTIIPTGTLVLPLLGACGIVAGLRATFPRVADWLVGASVLSVIVLYTPALQPLPGTSYSVISALLTLASLAGLAYITFGRGAAVESRL
jgi:hypothetical protein